MADQSLSWDWSVWIFASVSSEVGDVQRGQVQVKWKPEERCCWRRWVGSRGDVSVLGVSKALKDRDSEIELTGYRYFFACLDGPRDADEVRD